MKLTLVDTSHWVGAFSRRDDYKEEGKKFLEWFDQQDEKKSKIITTYRVLTEVIAWLLRKDDFKKAKEVLEFILNNPKIEIYNQSRELEEIIFEIFKKYGVLSLVDSELVVIYKNLRCDQLLSTDNGFKQCSGINLFRYPY